jgi:hypothetical protein
MTAGKYGVRDLPGIFLVAVVSWVSGRHPGWPHPIEEAIKG